MSITVSDNRIEFIDAMRGFTMLLVVFSHALTISFKSDPVFSFNEIFLSFRMPLFFFLSGFLCYKSGKFMEMKENLGFIKKKFIVQMIPTFIFITIYSVLFQQPYGEMWLHVYKGGYWFTFVLFFFFLFLVLSFSISKLFKGKCLMLLIIMGGVLVYLISLFTMHPSCPWKGSWVAGFFSISQFKYYIYFLFGVLVKRQYEQFDAFVEKSWFIAVVIILFFVLQTISHFITDQTHGIMWQIEGSIIKPILGFLGVTIVFSCFKKYKESFSKNTFIGRALQYIGQRTLDIYLLHFFVLPQNLQMVGDFFAKYNNPLLELIAGLVLAMLIIGFCLFISNVIRRSDVLAKLLFGKIIPSNNNYSESQR